MQSKLKRVHEESKLKSAALEDATKRYREVAVRSSEMSRLYDVLKLEKNKYMNQIQASKQRSLEMQEKIRILSGEVEILRTELAAKEKELSNQKLEALNAVSARDLMRQETNKHMLVYREHRDTVDQNASSLSVLQNTVESQERELILLKTQYEKTIEERNSRVSQLLERNDELCLLYERFNLQEKVLVKAEMEMQNRLDDIKQLQLEETDLTRHITLLRTTSTKTDDSRETVCALQEELEAIRMLETYLTTRAEDPFYKECEALLKTKREDDKSRGKCRISDNGYFFETCRILAVCSSHTEIIGAMNKLSVNMEAMLKKRAKNLPGKDPTAQDLAKRFNQLSAKLAQKEELLLEKELIINEVESLTTRLQDQVTQSREQSNTRNTEMSDLNYRIKSINRVMMSTVSELAMNQAQALRLEQERTEKQELLKFAEDNMAKGLAPSLEMQQAWEKAEMTRLKQSIERSNAKQELATQVDMLGIQPDDVQVAPESGVTESIFFSLPNGVRTTACPRPNAYISDAQKDTTLDGNPIHELPIPKPYGQFAPLKPSAMSVPMMRMARKQVAKEDPPSVATAEEYSTVVATSAYSIANFASMTPASMASVPMTPATPSGKTSATPNGNNALRFPSVSATAIV